MTEGTETPDLRRATLAGVRWIGIARGVAETTALMSTIVLARLISPSEFGRAAIALIVVALAATLGPAGLTAPLVQRRLLERGEIESAAFLALAAGLALTGLTFAFAVLVGRPLFGDETAELIAIASLSWLIAGLGATPQAQLQRDLLFRQLAILDSASVLAGAATAVALALAGVEAEAIVVGALVMLAGGTALALLWAPLHWPRPTRSGIEAIRGFGLSTALSSLVYAAFRNVDYLILGARLSAAAVGFYWRAYQLGVEYQSKFSQIMLRVSFPVFSRTESLAELRALRMRIVRVHATILVPILAVFVALAPAIIPFVYGSAWEPAVAPAQIMAVAGIGNALVTGTGPLMVAIGRPGALLTWNLVELTAYAAMVFLLAPHGLIAVALGVAIFSVIGVVLTQFVLLRSFLGIPFGDFVAETLPGLVVGGCVLIGVVAVRVLLDEAGVPTILVIAVCSLTALTVYVGVLRLVFSDTWSDLASILRRVTGAQEPH